MEKDFGQNLEGDYEADIADLEERLYSKIHHEESYETVNPLNTEQPTTSRHVTNSSVVNSSVASNPSGGRYWAGNNKRSYPPKETGYLGNKPKPVILGKNVIQSDKNNPIQNRPKPLAPYTSFLSQMNLKDTEEETPSTTPVPSTSKTSKNKKSDTENKKDQEEPEIHPSLVKNIIKQMNSKAANKNINPFSKNLPVKTKKLEKLQAKKVRAAKNRKNKNIPVVILDSSDDGDDDDVIEIPLPKPPLISIDSSDSESVASKSEFLSPNVKKKFKQKSTNSRCNSPASIMSDDFIMPNDRSRLNESRESLNILEDEELQMNQTVDSVVTKKRLNTSQNLIKKIADVLKINEARNVPAVVESEKTTTKNYEVNNLIASVDIYESESSDMPDSVYNRVKDKKAVPEDKEDAGDGKLQKKSKRMRKRKSSGSNKGSELSSSDEDEFTIKNIVTTSSPYIMRGEAVQNAITDGAGKKSKIPNKRRRFDSRVESDEEFISILSSIVHPDSESDDEEDTSKEKSLDARDLVNHLKVVDEENEEEIVSVSEKNISTIEDESENAFDDIQINVEIPQKEDELVMSVDECPDVLEMQCERRSPLVDQFEIGWNDEMRKFYNNSWGGEDFDIDEVMGSMSANADWKIKNDDQYPKTAIPGNTRMKCFNCFEFGHMRAKCRAPFKKIICHMCGEANHSEPRCPNKICLKCGMETKVFIKGCNNCFYRENQSCYTCNVRGHTAQICPDRWRRYHSTITDNTELTQSNGTNKRRYCSICAEKGHVAEKCKNSLRCLDYPVPTTKILSYTKQYTEQVDENLIQFPYVKMALHPPDFEFDWDNEQIASDGFYNRFLNSVGLKKRVKKRKSVGKLKKKDNKKKKMVINPVSVAQQNKEEEITNFNFSNELNKLNETGQAFDLNFITEGIASNNTSITSSKNESSVENVSRTDARSVFMNELAEETKTNEKTVQKKRKTDETHDDDSNYSFSEFYDPNNDITLPEEPKDPKDLNVSKEVVTPAPDFISISEAPKIKHKVEIVRDPETFSNQLPTTITDAKIFLTKPNCKSLLSPNGTEFLKNAMETFHVSVRLEWQNVGNVLHIKGTTINQDEFHEKLIEYIQKQHEEQYRKRQQISSLVPKNKFALIRYIKNQFLLLTTNLGHVESWYQKMREFERIESSNARKGADKARKHLNMILIGQTGLLEGKQHLTALKNNLTSLEHNLIDEVISKDVRNDVFQHVNYIFGPFVHTDYVGLINKYRDLKKEAKNPTKPDVKTVVVKPVVVKPAVAKPPEETAKAPPKTVEPVVETSCGKNEPSVEWSQKCVEIILKCLELPKIKNTPLVKCRLDRVHAKAIANGLSKHDHLALMKIYETSSKDR